MPYPRAHLFCVFRNKLRPLNLRKPDAFILRITHHTCQLPADLSAGGIGLARK